jgi:hypothetical protein
MGGTVYHDYEVAYRPPPGSFANEPSGPVWLCRIFGDYFFAEVVRVESYGNSTITDAALDPISGFRHIE